MKLFWSKIFSDIYPTQNSRNVFDRVNFVFYIFFVEFNFFIIKMKDNVLKLHVENPKT